MFANSYRLLVAPITIHMSDSLHQTIITKSHKYMFLHRLIKAQRVKQQLMCCCCWCGSAPWAQRVLGLRDQDRRCCRRNTDAGGEGGRERPPLQWHQQQHQYTWLLTGGFCPSVWAQAFPECAENFHTAWPCCWISCHVTAVTRKLFVFSHKRCDTLTGVAKMVSGYLICWDYLQLFLLPMTTSCFFSLDLWAQLTGSKDFYCLNH